MLENYVDLHHHIPSDALILENIFKSTFCHFEITCTSIV